LRSFKDVVTKTVLNCEVGENVQFELEGNGSSMDIVLDKGDAVACAFYLLQKSLVSKEEVETLCEMLKERLDVA
jgi:hypothetical protein